jgi:hypothetical protein
MIGPVNGAAGLSAMPPSARPMRGVASFSPEAGLIALEGRLTRGWRWSMREMRIADGSGLGCGIAIDQLV